MAMTGTEVQGEEVYFTDAAAAFRTLNLGGGGSADSSSSSSDDEGDSEAALAARQRATRPVRTPTLVDTYCFPYTGRDLPRN